MSDQHTDCFEDLLEKTGWGAYSKFILLLVCACSFVQAVTCLALPFGISTSSCENHLDHSLLLGIYTSNQIGRCLGGLILNSFSDRYGRKKYLSYSFVLIFTSTFVTAFAYNYYVMLGTSFFLGVGLESNVCNARILLMEILPKKKRGFYMIFCDIFWTFGYYFISLFAIFMKNPTTESRGMDLRLTTWRTIFAISGALNVLVACACALIEESPRYLLHVEKNHLGFLVLKQTFAINTSSYADNVPITEGEVKDRIGQYGLNYEEPIGYRAVGKNLAIRVYKSVKLLFSKRFTSTTFLLMAFKMPLMMTGHLEVNIYLAKQMNTTTATYLQYEGMDVVFPIELHDATAICMTLKNGLGFYSFFLIISSGMLIGQLVCLVVVDRCGRRSLLVAATLVSAMGYLFLSFFSYFVYTNLVVAILLLTAFSILSSVITLVAVESFPTAVRGTAWGVTNCLGLFIVALFIRFLDTFYQTFNMITGIGFACFSVLTCFLLDLRNLPMIE